jgi:ribonuclease P protein component
LTLKKLTFSKDKRLQTPADFQAVFADTILRARTAYFTMLARPNERECARLGVIVAKRIIRRAVGRNAIRRLIRESFRINQCRLVGLDVIVLVRSVLPKEPNAVFLDCLVQQWQDLIAQWQKA